MSDVLLLNIILVVMGIVVSPLLGGILWTLVKLSKNVDTTMASLTEVVSTLANVTKELNEARVRDTALEGRIKGINEKLDRHISEDRNK